MQEQPHTSPGGVPPPLPELTKNSDLEPAPNGSKEIGAICAAVLVGALSGAAVIGFKNGISFVRHTVFEGPFAELLNELTRPLYSLRVVDASLNIQYLLFPLFGGLLTAAWLKLLDRKDFGVPLPGQLEEVDKGVPPDLKLLITRQLAAVSALGSGASLGPEGPSVEIGVSISRAVSQLFGYGHEFRRVLASAGAAAGVSAGFDAPLSGVMFALELIQPSVAPDRSDKDNAVAFRATAGAVLTSAAIACVVSRYGAFGDDKFLVTRYELVDPLLEIPLYMSLGVLSGVVGATFRSTVVNMRKVYGGEKEGFEFMKKVAPELKPLIATTLCGFVAIKYPETLFFGYNAVNSILSEKSAYIHSIPELFTLLSLKIGLTASCLASGLMGGTFAPALFFGASLGAAYDEALKAVLPAQFEIAGTSNYAMVGAAAMLGAVFRAPITGILLLFELTRDYDIVLPLISSVGLATVTIDLIEGESTPPTWAWWWQPNPLDTAVGPVPSALQVKVADIAKASGSGDTDEAIKTIQRLESGEAISVKRLTSTAKAMGMREELEAVLPTGEEAEPEELSSTQALSVVIALVESKEREATGVPAEVE